MWLNELDEAKGLDHGETYNNRLSRTLFLENISRVEKDNLQKFISDIIFFSLTMDQCLKYFLASKKIRVTGPNGIMVAQTFCDIFFYEKKTSDINI
jgi:hypothetical protein